MADMPPGRTAAEYLQAAAQAESEGRAPGSSTRGTRRRTSQRQTEGDAIPGAPPADSEPKRLTPSLKVLHEGVLGLYTTAEMMCYMFDAETAAIISATKVRATDAWIELAEKDKKVKDLLTKITTGSAWGGVFAAHIPMVIPILAKRGIIPGGALFGASLMNAMEATEATGVDESQMMADIMGEQLAHDGTVNFG